MGLTPAPLCKIGILGHPLERNMTSAYEKQLSCMVKWWKAWVTDWNGFTKRRPTVSSGVHLAVARGDILKNTSFISYFLSISTDHLSRHVVADSFIEDQVQEIEFSILPRRVGLRHESSGGLWKQQHVGGSPADCSVQLWLLQAGQGMEFGAPYESGERVYVRSIFWWRGET